VAVLMAALLDDAIALCFMGVSSSLISWAFCSV
jgi:hypothetical protein